MAEVKISELTPATFVNATDITVIVQGGVTYKLPVNLFLDLVAGMFQPNDGLTWTYDNILNTITPNFSVVVSADDVEVQKIGTPAVNTVQEMFNVLTSPGWLTGGLITDAGGGTINIAAGTGIIRILDDDISTVKSFGWAALNGAVIPANSVRHVGVVYNAGAPIIEVHTTEDWDLDTSFPLGKVVYENGVLTISQTPWKTGDAVADILERLDSLEPISRDNRLGGLLLSNTGVRNVALSSGALMARLAGFPIPSLDTSLAGTFQTYYQDGLGGWILTTALTQWDNTNYDDGTGVLAALTALYYTSRWFYLSLDGTLSVVYGQAQYSTVGGLVDSDSPPSSLPKKLQETGILIGRFIIQQGSAVPIKIESAFATIFKASQVTDHGQLSGLADDDHTQYHTDARALVWLNALLATREFTSAQQVITSAGLLTIPHGLGAVPKDIQFFLVNQVAEHGYSIGDITMANIEADEGQDMGLAVVLDATNIRIRYGARATVFKAVNFTTGVRQNLTNANWRLVVRAWV